MATQPKPQPLPFRAKPGICFFLLLLTFAARTNAQSERPQILGVGGVRITSSSITGDAIGFYLTELGFGGGQTVCQGASNMCLEVNKHQRIDLYVPKAAGTRGELSAVYFETSDAKGMRQYLTTRGILATEIVSSAASQAFRIADPDGHQIGFIQYTRSDEFSHPQNQVSSRLIHVGFMVRDQAAMEHFYKDILGFRPYWHGGMKDDRTDWVSLQVPDGTDWVEFMVNVSENADQRLRGIMNHIALGVPDIQAAREQLVRNGVHLTEQPKLGRDGKWQLNLYDPDQTRIEFMEFTPKEKPCCSEFTGPHPKP